MGGRLIMDGIIVGGVDIKAGVLDFAEGIEAS